MIRAIIYVWLILLFYTPSCYAENWNLLGYYDNEDIVVYNDRSETNWRKRYNTSQRGWIWDINTVIMEKKSSNGVPIRKYKISYRVVEVYGIGVPISFKMSTYSRWNTTTKEWEDDKKVDKKRYKVGSNTKREKIGISLFEFCKKF